MKKEMLINVLQPEECRIAIVEDGVLEELYVERTSHESYTGNIYKAKVVNLEPAIQAAFLDFSVGRNGFLHVSDVEPQYYRRHEAAEAPRPSSSARPAGPSAFGEPEPGPRDRAWEPRRDRERDRDRDRGRDRPDRMEKGRRDRSEPRRFGEGLLGEDVEGIPAPPSRPVREEPPAREDRPRAEAPAPPPPARPERDREREPRAAEPEPRARLGRSVEAYLPEPPAARPGRPVEPPAPPPARPGRDVESYYDPDLPPSRTQRSRPATPPPASPELPLEDVLDMLRPPAARPAPAEPDEPEPPAAREPRRGRGRGRGRARAAEPEVPVEPEPEPEPPAIEDRAPIEEAEPDDLTESPRRRGGRAAIRSRGGDRGPERPRERPRAAEPAPAFEPERPAEPELPRARAPREVERDRERERPRAAEPEPAPRERERLSPHARAGEPGYVPRRERTRDLDAGFGAGIEPAEPIPATAPPPAFWSDEAPPRAPVAPPAGSEDEEEDEGSRAEGGRRRRRRRRRRGEPADRTGREPATPEARRGPGALAPDDFEDLGPEAEAEAEAEQLYEPAPAARRRPEPEEDEDFGPDGDDFDFVDEVEASVEDEDESAGLLVEDEHEHDRVPAPRRPEDEIDPELEEEIRKEIEEIAEIEREMGLRGTTEARPGRGTRGRGQPKPNIQDIFRRGDEVLVQVIKESIGTKGPTLSTYISIPGRYLVLMPGLNRVGVSRKIADESQRRKLREIMNELNPPQGLGFIVRTAGLDRTKRELAQDLAYLLRLWKVILRRIKKARGPAPIYQESDMLTRTLRDIFSTDIDTIWIDEPNAFERAQEFMRAIMPRYVNRLRFYDEKVPLFHKYGIEDEITRIQRRRVDLPGGGSIVIDQTEALVAIDVNSGNFRVEDDAERTAYEMNLRAAKEIARQLRLRDLGGVICNDFIDMRDERHRRGVEKALRDAIQRDRARTKVLHMSQFGIIEMTRQRIRPSLRRSVYEDCAHCKGAGVVKTAESMSIDVMRLLALASHRGEVRRVNVTVCAPVASYLNNRKRSEIARLESEANLIIHIRHEENAPPETLQLECFDAHNNEVRVLPPPPAPPRRGR